MIQVNIASTSDQFASLQEALFFISRDDRAPHAQAVIDLHAKAARTPARWVTNYQPFFGVRNIDYSGTDKNGAALTAQTTPAPDQRTRQTVVSVIVF